MIFAVARLGEGWCVDERPSPRPSGRSPREVGPSIAAGADVKRGETPRAPPRGRGSTRATSRRAQPAELRNLIANLLLFLGGSAGARDLFRLDRGGVEFLGRRDHLLERGVEGWFLSLVEP